MKETDKILIYQIGSLGDTIVSMPCYREIARRHPNSERFLLTNFPIGSKMVQAEVLLKSTGMILGAVEYPMPLRGVKNIYTLFCKLRNLKINTLYYLTPEKKLSNLVRHYAFLKFCGIRTVYGVPWSKDLRFPRKISEAMWESEASRLLRCIDPFRPVAPPHPADRDLSLTIQEIARAKNLLQTNPKISAFIAVSVGGKVPLNNWGDRAWSEVLSELSSTDPTLGLVLVGSADERERNENLLQSWCGPKINSCGLLTPRETAALLSTAQLFLGHDTGTLHLTAAVDTRVIGVYSARNVPGKWYSDRQGDKFFYNKTPCFGCELEQPNDCPHQLVCMTSHSPKDVVAAAIEVLSRKSSPCDP